MIYSKQDMLAASKAYKKPAKKKTKTETGIYILSYDHDWGSRGNRRISEFYFRSKPDADKITKVLNDHGLDAARTEVWTLSRKQCCKSYETSFGRNF